MSNQLRVRILLGAMMFFQYAAWGAWAPVLGATLGSPDGVFKASGTVIGAIFGILWLACIVVPFVGGQLVDRKVPGQLYMGVSAVVCAASAWMMSSQSTTGDLVGGLLPTSGLGLWLVVWSIAFAPTIGIGNSMCLHHLGRETGGGAPAGPKAKVNFTVAGIVLGIAVAGANQFLWKLAAFANVELTSIFFLALMILAAATAFKLVHAPDADGAFSAMRTMGTIAWVVVAFVVSWAKTSLTSIPVSEMAVAAGAGALWAVASFLVPHTPPNKQAPDPWAFLKAFGLFKAVPGFTAFILISLVASAEFQFFYTLSGQFLGSLGIPEPQIAPFKASSQLAEIFALAILLPICLRKFGMRTTLVLGTLAWSLRYFIFATKLVVPVIASLTLHGVGFAFVFITSYFYIDRVAPKDIRGSAQSLFTLVTLGVGNYLGSVLSGKLQDGFTTTVAGAPVVNWPMVFVVPAVLTLASAIAFAATFKEPKADPSEPATLPAH
ncbi:MAG: MFS transporter [Armatimonadota bacterium]